MKKINIGDIVEVQYPSDHTYAEWNGFQFRITEKPKPSKHSIEGEVIKTVSGMEQYTVGRWFSWGDPGALVVVAPSAASFIPFFPAGIFDEEEEPVIKIKLSDIDKIKLGDVVECQYAESSWNGIQFRVTEHQPGLHYKGTIVKTTEKQAKSRPVGSEFTWSCAEGLIVIKPKSEPTKTKRFNVGDIVEPRFASSGQHAYWNSLRLRITAIKSKYTIEGEVLATASDPNLARHHPLGTITSWSNPDVLVIIKEDVARDDEPIAWSTQEEPSPNQVYIDHLYGRLTQNATKQELLNLAAKLEGFVTGMVVHARPWPEETKL